MAKYRITEIQGQPQTFNLITLVNGKEHYDTLRLRPGETVDVEMSRMETDLTNAEQMGIVVIEPLDAAPTQPAAKTVNKEG